MTRKPKYRCNLGMDKFKPRKPLLVIPVGLPACGKTFNRPGDCVILCKDEIRAMLYNQATTGITFEKTFENIIGYMEWELFKMLIDEGVNIYLDATNYYVSHRIKFCSYAFVNNYKIIYYSFYNAEIAEERNLKRDRIVPKESFDYIKKGLQMPQKDELKRYKIKEVVIKY